MNAFFAPYKLWIEIGILALLASAVLWGVHLYNEHFRELGRIEVRAEWAAVDLVAEKAAQEKEAMWNKQLEEANANFTKRQEAQTAALAAANTAVNGLSGSLARIRNGLSNNPTSAGANARIALALATVFGDCSQKYIGMAEIAGRHANDVQRILESWPKNEVAK